MALEKMLAIGESRHHGKINGITAGKIYSWGTYRTYLRCLCRFAKWLREKYGVKYISEGKECSYLYIAFLKEKGKSASTLKTGASAWAKLSGCRSNELRIVPPARCRADFKKSRTFRTYSSRQREFIEFCISTGLRRRELRGLRGNQFIIEDNIYKLIDVKGKGGRIREVWIYPIYQETVRRLCTAVGGERVWSKIPSHVGIHYFRALYANLWYRLIARTVEKIPYKERYYCKKDQKGAAIGGVCCLYRSYLDTHESMYLHTIIGDQTTLWL